MPEEIEITRIEVSEPRVSMPDEVLGHQEKYIDVTIYLHNRTTRTLYVMSSMKRFNYDATTQRLSVALTNEAPQAAPEMRIRSQHITVPSMQPLLPDGSLVVRVAVPLTIRRLSLPNSRGEFVMDEQPIVGIREVSCRVAYDEVPFKPVYTDSTDELLKKLATWGKTAEAAQFIQPE